MTRPDWNQKQKPHSKSKEHGKRDHQHGPHEHGLGGERDLGHEHGPKQKDTDLSIIEPDEGEPEVSAGDGEPLVGVTTLPSSFYVPYVPPVTDQGTSPQCVAYSNAYDQNQHDRKETGKFWNFDEAAFFRAIGGTSAGAYLSRGLDRRKAVGFPEQDSTPNPGIHRIAGYVQIPLTVEAIKAAIIQPVGVAAHGVILIGDWFHSWYHPLASGKLPAPDYKVGGHAQWFRGWNDAYGFRLRNSWGTDWGLAGDAFVPYAFLSRYYAAYRAIDK